MIGTVGEDIAAERYRKDLQRSRGPLESGTTLDKTVTVFKTLREKLGKMENRVAPLRYGTEQLWWAIEGQRVHTLRINRALRKAKAWKLSLSCSATRVATSAVFC